MKSILPVFFILSAVSPSLVEPKEVSNPKEVSKSKASSPQPKQAFEGTKLVSLPKLPRIERLAQLNQLQELLYDVCDEILYVLELNPQNDPTTRLWSSAKNCFDQFAFHRSNDAKLAVLQNPLASYVLAKRLMYSFESLQDVFENPHYEKALETVTSKFEKGRKLLKPEDIQEFTEPILQLQRLLMLDPSEIAEGRLLHFNGTTILNGGHCYELGKAALKKSWFVESILWLRHGLEMFESKGLRNEAVRLWILLEHAVQQHNEHYRLDHDFFLQPIEYNIDSEFVSVRSVEHEAFARRKYRGGHAKENLTFSALCRGETFQTETEKSELFCWYEYKRSPYLTINPIKSELVSRNPVIIQFYNVATNKAVQSIRTMYDKAPKIEATNRQTEDFTDAFSSPKFMILERPESLKFLKVLARVTGIRFSPRYCRNLEGRFHVFSPGGFDIIKTDMVGYHPKHHGDRFATAILYLSEDVHGGDTVFPYAGVAVKPIPGSVLLTYNALPNGWLDDRSLYGICPTVFGHNYFMKFWPTHGIPVSSDQDCQPDQSYFTFSANGQPIFTDDPLPDMVNSEVYDDTSFLPYQEPVKIAQSPRRNPFRF